MARSLLSLFPAASALLAFRANADPVPQPAFTEAGFAITVHCWSFKEFSLFEAIEMAAASGAGGVELFPGQKLGGKNGDATLHPEMTDAALDKLIKHLTKHHVTAINLGVIPVPNDEPQARRIFDFAKRLGLYGITTESLESIDLLEQLSSETDITVSFHNHPKPTALWNPATILQALEGRHANLGFCADIGHWASSGLDPFDVVRKIAPRIRSFHVKDRASVTEWSRDQPLGTGIIDIPTILSIALDHGFVGNVSIEYEANWNSNLPEIAQCVGYLRACAQLQR
ncbi:MAG: sugar phosphate isomerase/epimerase [Verrucomicrobiota bacterium]